MMLELMLAAAAQGLAIAGEPRFDVQCAIAAQSAHDQAEESAKPAMLLSVMYYFGRIDGALSSPEIERLFAEEGPVLEGQPLGPLLLRCGEFMMARGKAMEDIGKRLDGSQRARIVE